jgi:hypothetical protein
MKKVDIKKLVLSVLIVSIIIPTVLFSNPKKASATVPVADWLNTTFHAIASAAGVSNSGLHLEDFAKTVLKEVIISIEKKLLQQLTQSTVNWINSGFSGSPLFVQNPDSFFGDIGKSEIKSLTNEIGYDPNRYPFGQGFILNVINSYKTTSAMDAQYSLSKVVNDPTLLNNYRTNFATGGWNGFLINTMYPQNNYMGFQMTETDLLAQKLQGVVQNTTQKVQKTLEQGNGFLSPKTCSTNPNYNTMNNEFNPPTFNGTQAQADLANSIPDCDPQPSCSNQADIDAFYANDSQALDNGMVPDCIPQPPCSNQAEIDSVLDSMQTSYDKAQTAFNDPHGTNYCPPRADGSSGLVATTPGSVVASQITNAMGSTFRQSELGAALGNSIGAILDSLMNHFLNEGLSAMSSVVAGTPPAPDNWSYQGQTLGANTTGTTNPLVVPTSVLVKTGSTTAPATISGGVAPYTIQTQPNNKIATAKISGTSLTVTGVSSGQTSVVIQDSSTPIKTATIQITTSLILDFNNPLALQNITASVQNGTSLTMSGGAQPYNITTQPDSGIALALISNNTLAIVGVNPGITSVTIQDSSGININLNITVGNETLLSIMPKNIFTDTTTTVNATISGGTPPYTITTPSDPSVANAAVSGNTLIVSGVSLGNTTSVTIQDSFSPAETITVPITIITITGTSTTGLPTVINGVNTTLGQ